MKKKAIIILSLVCLVFFESCNSQTKKNQTENKKMEVQQTNFKEIDLLDLKYQEEITN